MKVVILGPASSVHILQWSKNLAKRGINVTLITQHSPILGFDDRIDIHVMPFKGWFGYFLNAIHVKRLLSRLKPDIMHVHYASGYGTTARLVNFHPYLLSIWGSDIFDFPNASFLHLWWLRGNLKSADVLASTSNVMAKEIQKHNLDCRFVAITPFGVDLDFFCPRKEIAMQSEIKIGIVKSLSFKYGVDILLKSFAMLRDRVNEDIAQRLRLIVVGGGDQEEELKQLSKDLKIDSSVEFFGKVPHAAVPTILGGFDIFCALSRMDSESFGVAVIEASACGIPVVVSCVGGLPEVVRDGDTGIVVGNEDPLSASKALEFLIMNTECRKRMGALGRKLVEERYGWDTCVDAMLVAYKNTLVSKV